MKKLTIYLCAGILVLGLTACTRDNQEESGSQNTEQTSSQGTEQTGSSDDQQESSDASQDEPDDASTGTDDTSVEGGDEGGDVDGDTASGGWSQEMEGLKTAVTELLGSDYWPDMTLDAEMFETRFGVTSEMYDDFLAEMPMMSAHVDTLVVVKAKEGQADAVKAALEAYRESQINDTLQYPMNLAKVQGSKVEAVGDYVIFTMLGGDDTAAGDESEEAQITFNQERNDLVIETIKGELGQ